MISVGWDQVGRKVSADLRALVLLGMWCHCLGGKIS
jgi:hypothetical protein